MTKCEIMALIMRKEDQFEGDPFTAAAKLVYCLELLAGRQAIVKLSACNDGLPCDVRKILSDTVRRLSGLPV
ncbi:MAG: hypothetical protein ACM34A_09680 [Bacillota bacterium]